MVITITRPGEYLAETSDEPKPGARYALEDAATGTNAQNKAFHALLTEYWRSGMHSYPAKSFDDFRNCIKRSLGAGFEAFVYAQIVDGKAIIKDAPTMLDVPEGVRNDPDLKKLVRGRLKSWSDYTKRQRCDTLDRLIAEMINAGVNTKKFDEIMSGMEKVTA